MSRSIQETEAAGAKAEIQVMFHIRLPLGKLSRTVACSLRLFQFFFNPPQTRLNRYGFKTETKFWKTFRSH